MPQTKRKVTYCFQPDLSGYYYGEKHPMKPVRIAMTNSLVYSSNLYQDLAMLRVSRCSKELLCRFHDSEYVDALFSSENLFKTRARLPESVRNTYNIGSRDCPVFEGLTEYTRIYTGASMACAVAINYGQADVAINWMGGLHHSKMNMASGFCYVNDIVLCILELLKHHSRVLYIDIDVHHGDGVEEAFLNSNRVLTWSLHQSETRNKDIMFPGTGHIDQIGVDRGKYYTVNVPLKPGINDQMYLDELFKPILQRIMTNYQPEVIVLQCGADSVTGDRIGEFNLTPKGHAACVRAVLNTGAKVVMLGGGGYTPANVSRTWFYETAVAAGCDGMLPETLPADTFLECYCKGGAEPLLHWEADPSNQPVDSRRDIEQLRAKVLENLRHVRPVGVPMKERPPSFMSDDETRSALQEKDERERAPSPLGRSRRDVQSNGPCDSSDAARDGGSSLLGKRGRQQLSGGSGTSGASLGPSSAPPLASSSGTTSQR